MSLSIYEQGKYKKLGLKVWNEMFLELIEFKDLIWRLFLRNLQAKYKQTILGIAWALIMPFVAIGTFIFLNKAGIFNVGETSVPYPLFALIGLTIWQIFATGLQAGTSSVVEAGGMIAKINFPRETLILSSMAQAIFEFFIKFILILICFALFKYQPNWLGLILFPFALLPILFLTIGLSLFLSLLNGIFRDTANIVSLIVTFLMFLTPVLYPTTETNKAYFAYNPLSILIEAPRELLIHGSISALSMYCVISSGCLLLCIIMWRAFHIVETKIPERV